MYIDFKAKYRFFNKIMVRDNYSLPLIEDQFDMMEGKYFF